METRDASTLAIPRGDDMMRATIWRNAMDDRKITPDGIERSWLGRYNGPHRDLREYIERCERAGEILRVPGANWDLEIGALCEIIAHKRSEAPATLFEDIEGYPKGFRAVSGLSNSARRLALTLGFDDPKSGVDVVQAYRDRMKHHRPIPPVVVKRGPVLENVDRDDDVNLWKFPVPRLHEQDGGRYIGTEDLIIMRDPDGGWGSGCGRRLDRPGAWRHAIHGGRLPTRPRDDEPEF